MLIMPVRGIVNISREKFSSEAGIKLIIAERAIDLEINSNNLPR
jgi:hypothetical protein